MTYQVLARKWRPKTFAELIGQGPIVTALTNALTERRIGQAYLFSGIRGVGKTTAARLLAKALNCAQGPTATPCNECLPCREIAAGADLDVIEIDAATYSKVEQVRELTESLKYGPARNRYKVVVLDEIHRLSRQAFDALLKIVEEPPRHLVFIFATTEIEAVPATILSRCQEFQFRRVQATELAGHLREIATAEGIAASDRALRLVARAGEGSVRDSVALLDQLATFGAGTISDEDAAHVLGGLDSAFLAELLGALVDGRAAEVSRLVGRLEAEGWDPRHAYVQLLGLGRDALRLAAGGDAERLDLPQEDAAQLAVLARRTGYENLLRLLHHLLASETTVRRSEAGALALEIALLRAAELPKLVRVEELLAGGGALSAPPRPPGPDPAPKAQPPAQPPTPTPAPGPRAAPPPSPAPAPPRAAADPVPEAPPPPAAAASADPLAALLEEIGSRRLQLVAHLQEAASLRFDDGVLTVVTRPDDTLLARTLDRQVVREVLDEAVRQVGGAGASWRIVKGRAGSTAAVEGGGEDDAEAAEGAAGAQEGSPPAPEVTNHPAVQTMLRLFEGKVETVERQAGDGEEEP